jgi:hypothetical protein
MTKKALNRLLDGMIDEIAVRAVAIENGGPCPEKVELEGDAIDEARTLFGMAVRKLRRSIVDAALPLPEGIEDPILRVGTSEPDTANVA